MTIYINGRFLTQKITGVQRYAIELVKALDKVLDRHDEKIIILSPNNLITTLDLKNIQVHCMGKLSGHFWEQLELPLFVKNSTLVNLCNAGPICKRNQVTVIHDMAVFANEQNFSFVFRNWYKFLLKMQSIFSRKIVTVSNFSRLEIAKYLKLKTNEIEVIYEGKEHFTTLKTDERYIELHNLNEKPFLLAVSSLNPNKNFQSIVNAMKYMDSEKFNIVIAGGTDPKVFSSKGTSLPENVIHLGYVTDMELKALYANAFCFIYPSLYEGFGLPPLEAMSVGCPIIISERASLPEVGGEAALYCDPTRPASIADQVLKIKNSEAIRNNLIEKGREQAEKFSWDKCAKELMAILK